MWERQNSTNLKRLSMARLCAVTSSFRPGITLSIPSWPDPVPLVKPKDKYYKADFINCKSSITKIYLVYLTLGF